MLEVLRPEEVADLLRTEFDAGTAGCEEVPLPEALGRVLAEPVLAEEYVPDFDRSTVDGYAVRAKDTFGCSDALPALLQGAGKVLMGEAPGFSLKEGECGEIPTGGELPENADSVVMVEYTENYGDGTIGILKSAAPGMNVIYRGDDVKPGQEVLSAGTVLGACEIGSLAAMGKGSVCVRKPLRVGILSTGDELVPPEEKPGPGQIRDVNSLLLDAMLRENGAVPVSFGILRDQEEVLEKTLREAVRVCDVVLVSGGSSAGEKDATSRVIGRIGRLLMHGIAIKPGKPTILGKVEGKPVFGLPGHPAAACFITRLFVIPLLFRMQGRHEKPRVMEARLSESVGANHGRAQVMGVRLKEREGELYALPIRGKSGLITSLAESDGYFMIDRDCEGLPEGARIRVRPL